MTNIAVTEKGRKRMPDKKFIYETNELPGRLTFTIIPYTPNTIILNEIEAAYMAWHDLEDPDICLPEYIIMCLNDSGITVKQWDFEFYDERKRFLL